MALSDIKYKIPKLKPKFFFGLSHGIRGNVQFISDDVIMYPIGRVFIYHNLTTNVQQYLKIPITHKEVTAIAMSPSRQVLAIGEKAERPTIAVYNVETKKRIKLLGNPIKGCSSTRFEFVQFTQDNVNIVGVTGEPDWMVIFYDWKKGKVDSYFKACAKDNVSCTITQFISNPVDSTICCVSGLGIFRLMSFSDGVWKQYGFQRAEKLPICCACWLTGEIVLVGTKDGRLIAIEYAELKGVYIVNEVTDIHIVKKGAGKREQVHLASNLIPKKHRKGYFEVRCLVSFANGFAFSCSRGLVTVFERVDTTRWVKKNILQTTNPLSDVDKVWAIALSPSLKSIACTTGKSEIYYGEMLVEQDLEKLPRKKFNIMLNGYHRGPVCAITTCLWKPIFMSVGEEDRTCRIWNYETKELVLVKDFSDDIYSACFHPSGLYCLLGFTDKLKMFIILIDDLKPIRMIDIRNCPLVTFSSGGHLFAAVNGVNVEVYSVTTFQNLWTLRGHIGPVRGVRFIQQDYFLITCGNEGSVYRWDIRTGDRVEEVTIKSVGNYDVGAVKPGNLVYAVGTDGTLKEIEGGQVKRSVNLDQYSLYSLAVAACDKALFVAGEKCSIVSVVYPLVYPPVFKDYKMHSKPVKQMILTANDKFLVSLGVEGTIGIWQVKIPKKKLMSSETYPEITDMIISAEKWLEKSKIIKEQKLRMIEMVSEHAYMILQINTAHDLKVAEIMDNYQQKIDELKGTIERNEKRHLMEIYQYDMKLEETSNYYTNELVKQSWDYEKRIKEDWAKNESLKIKLKNVFFEARKLIESTEQATKSVLKTHEYFSTLEIARGESEMKKLKEKITDLITKHEHCKLTMEDDHDKEIVAVKAKYNARITKLEVQNKVISKDNKLLTEKITSLEQQLEEYLKVVKALRAQREQLQETTKNLMTKVNAIQAELDERDWAIKKKDEFVVQVTRKNEGFAKEHFVRDVRIENLWRLIEPMDLERKQRRKKEAWLRSELEKMSATIVRMGLFISSLQRRNDVLSSEIKREKEETHKVEYYIKRFKTDLHKSLVGANGKRSLKTAVLGLYRRYVHPKVSEDILRDYHDEKEKWKQRAHLEGAVKGVTNSLLRKENIADMTRECEEVLRAYNAENEFCTQKRYLGEAIEQMKFRLNEKPTIVLIQKNRSVHGGQLHYVNVMRELNTIRYCIDEVKKRNAELEKITGIRKGGKVSRAEAKEKFEEAVKKGERMDRENKLQAKEFMVAKSLLEEEIEELVKGKFKDYAQKSSSRLRKNAEDKIAEMVKTKELTHLERLLVKPSSVETIPSCCFKID